MSLIGTLRHVAASQHFSRFGSEADIEPRGARWPVRDDDLRDRGNNKWRRDHERARVSVSHVRVRLTSRKSTNRLRRANSNVKRRSLNVRFTPKATELLRRREMSRCANSGHSRFKLSPTKNPGTLPGAFPLTDAGQ